MFSQKLQDIHTPQALVLTPGGMEGDLRGHFGEGGWDRTSLRIGHLKDGDRWRAGSHECGQDGDPHPHPSPPPHGGPVALQGLTPCISPAGERNVLAHQALSALLS